MGALAALVTTAVLGAGCSSLGGTGDLEYVEGDGGVVQVDVADREDPVEVSGTTLEGDPLDLADYRGQVVVVNVWWSGCGPCRTEMPMLVNLADELGAETGASPKGSRGAEAGDQKGGQAAGGELDVAFVGIDIRDAAPESAQAFEAEYGVDYPSLFDPSSQTLLDFGRYVPRSPPSTLVLDREGRVAALISGPIPSELTLTDVLDDVTAEDS